MKKRIWIVTVLLFLFLSFGTMGIAAENGGQSICNANTDVSVLTLEETTVESEETEGEGRLPDTLDGWVSYIKEELLPIVVAVLTVVAAIYVAISPILARIKKASERFKEATADVNTATGTVRRNENRIAQMEEKFSQRLADMEAESAANREELKDIKEMLRMGFGNMNELVAKGHARRIYLIGKGDREAVWKEQKEAEREENSHT